MPNSKLKKIFIIGTCSIIISVMIVFLLASPIATFYAKKYGEKYIGRKIKMGLVYANPFTGYVHISNLIIYESDKDSVFISAKGLSANFALLKLLSKTVEISEVTLNQPKGIIIQNNKDFNFNDLIKRYTPVKPEKPN
jgi:hypothetical protein